jgi:hypothetical protein
VLTRRLFIRWIAAKRRIRVVGYAARLAGSQEAAFYRATINKSAK